MTDKEVCPSCGTECVLTPPTDKDAEILRQAALILRLKAQVETLEHELKLQNTTGG